MTRSKGKGLVVEDVKLMREVIAEMVSNLGYDLTEVGDAMAALAVCRSKMPDIVLLDWGLPEMDGMEFIARLRDIKGGDKVRVIMCAARDEVVDMVEALQRGACEFIMKPFTPQILASKNATIDF